VSKPASAFSQLSGRVWPHIITAWSTEELSVEVRTSREGHGQHALD